ncbi:MAG: hypothetical protein WCY88_15050 [Spongiibacteraceae bacterium]
MRGSLTGLLMALLVLAYPIAVYFGLQYLQPRFIGLVLLLLLGSRLFLMRQQLQHNIKPLLPALLVAALAALGAAVLNSQSLLLFTPFFISAASLVLFASSLWRPPSMIERIARIQEPDLDERGVVYTRKVTIVWCVFFVINGSLALYTALYCSVAIWTIYNGLLAYVLMGLLFAVEYLVRLQVRKRQTGKGNIPQ